MLLGMDDDATRGRNFSPEPPPLLVAEAARAACVSETTIRTWFDAGKLAGRRASNGLRLIDRRSLETLILGRLAE
jgi:hypothetical protein